MVCSEYHPNKWVVLKNQVKICEIVYEKGMLATVYQHGMHKTNNKPFFFVLTQVAEQY